MCLTNAFISVNPKKFALPSTITKSYLTFCHIIFYYFYYLFYFNIAHTFPSMFYCIIFVNNNM